MFERDRYSYIVMFAYIYFIAFPLFFLLMLIAADKNIPDFFEVFAYIFISIHLFIGITIVSRKRIGYVLLKHYLTVLKVGYPIGTMIANNILKYITDNDIDDYFK